MVKIGSDILGFTIISDFFWKRKKMYFKYLLSGTQMTLVLNSDALDVVTNRKIIIKEIKIQRK